MAYYESDKVKVFPTVRRNDEIDRNARLNTERNIVGLSNMISGGQSYILSGLNIDTNGRILSSGVCVINGYYFKIESAIKLNPHGNYLYFKIKVKSKADVTLYFTELVSTLDETTTLDDRNFFGLDIIFSDEPIQETDEDFVLLIAERIDAKWNNDNISSRVISKSNYIMDDGEISNS